MLLVLPLQVPAVLWIGKQGLSDGRRAGCAVGRVELLVPADIRKVDVVGREGQLAVGRVVVRRQVTPDRCDRGIQRVENVDRGQRRGQVGSLRAYVRDSRKEVVRQLALD